MEHSKPVRTPITRTFTLSITDHDGNSIKFCMVRNVHDGKIIWYNATSLSASLLDGFTITDIEGNVVYRGDRNTDEC